MYISYGKVILTYWQSVCRTIKNDVISDRRWELRFVIAYNEYISQSEDWIICFSWLRTNAMFDVTCFPAFVRVSDVITQAICRYNIFSLLQIYLPMGTVVTVKLAKKDKNFQFINIFIKPSPADIGRVQGYITLGSLYFVSASVCTLYL